MTNTTQMAHTYTVFSGTQKLLTGDLAAVLTLLKQRESQPQTYLTLVFDDQTGKQADFHLHGTLEEVLRRAEGAGSAGNVGNMPGNSAAPERTGPGRPKLGVIPREVTLLPRHWEWLEAQQGGASAVLRRLIDEARKRDPQGERIRAAQMTTDRFLGVMAGDLEGYEEATRALYQGNQEAFVQRVAAWPADIRDHALALAAPVFEQ